MSDGVNRKKAARQPLSAFELIDKFRGSLGQLGEDVDPAHAGVMWHIISLGHLITGELEGMLRGTGLSAADAFVLGVMAIEHDHNLRPSDIARILSVTPAAISLRIAKLEQAKLVDRMVDPSDRRAARLTLSPEGAALFREFSGKFAREGNFARALGKLPPEHRVLLEDLLSRLSQELDRYIVKP